MVKKEYDQGITLEEMADKLFVSEEYLSSQFKKEIGVGFKEMVRTLQIERIKELLTNTKLKLNQIAELAGYSDAKYMSRVFKDEVAYCQVNSVNRRIADTINALKKYSFIKKFTLLTLEKYDNMRSGNYR